MVTLAALCRANGLDMHQTGETELASKPAMSPLPGVYPDRQPIDSKGENHE
jgi:hypothetical protein